MGISHWAQADDRTHYERAYEASLELWPIPYERLEVPTPFGTTHVVTSGMPGGTAIVLIHAAALSATQWYPLAARRRD